MITDQRVMINDLQDVCPELEMLMSSLGRCCIRFLYDQYWQRFQTFRTTHSDHDLHKYRTVIYLQFYTCASQDSLGLYKVSPIENHCVHYRIFHYNFVSPGTR